jgi:hypothetical protein
MYTICRFKTEDEKEALLPVLRDLSRQEYLRKREDVKLVRAATLCFLPLRRPLLKCHP